VESQFPLRSNLDHPTAGEDVPTILHVALPMGQCQQLCPLDGQSPLVSLIIYNLVKLKNAIKITASKREKCGSMGTSVSGPLLPNKSVDLTNLLLSAILSIERNGKGKSNNSDFSFD